MLQRGNVASVLGALSREGNLDEFFNVNINNYMITKDFIMLSLALSGLIGN